MGKRKQASKYEHNHTYNPRARESDDRKAQSLKNLEMKRLQTAASKLRESLRAYIPLESRKKYKMDPMYELKGAARVAREFYRPPDYREEAQPVDVFEQLPGKLWEHEEGKKFLIAMMELGVGQHNIAGRSKDAVSTFEEMMQFDKEDHLLSRHRLLRVHLDQGDSLKARQLLDKYPEDNYSLFAYSRALIEFIALSLEESDASEKIRDDALMKAVEANPYTVWLIAHHDVFSEAIQHLDKLPSATSSVLQGSIEDALIFFEADLPLWQETDGLIEYVRDFLHSREIAPPLMEVNEEEEGDGEEKGECGESGESGRAKKDATEQEESSVGEDEEGDTEEQLSDEELHEMFLDMFNTGLELLEAAAEDEE